MAIYSTTAQQGIDVNAVFFLDPGAALEYPAPPFQPGELAWGTDGSEWVYCTASVSLNAGWAVVISNSIGPQGYNLTQTFGTGTWSVSPIGSAATTPYGQAVGVIGGGTGLVTVNAPSGTQTGAYFWVQRAGNVPNLAFGVNTGATGTINVPLYSPATVNSGVPATWTTSGGYGLLGLVYTNATASTTGPNTAFANYPYVVPSSFASLA